MYKHFMPILTVFFAYSVNGQQPFKVDLSLSENEILSLVKKQVISDLELKEVFFSTDNELTSSELIKLIPFFPGQKITSSEIGHFLWLVSKKKRFKGVNLFFEDTQEGVKFKCVFESRWVLSNIALSGISLDREKYLQYYEIRVGEEFSEEKHKASLEKFKQVFTQQGYKDATLTDRIEYHEPTKTVKVKLDCKRGSKFVINRCQATITTQQGESLDYLRKKIIEKFLKSLQGHAYDEELIAKKTKEIKDYLRKKGFLKSTLVFHEDIKNSKKQVELLFTITLGEKHSFVFFGNHFFTESQLFEMIFKFGESVLLVSPSLLAQDMTEAYRKKGFWNVTIETPEQAGEIYFVIAEGIRISIQEVVLRGVRDSYLKTVQRFFDPLARAKNFDAENLSKAVDATIDYYRKQGCWDCEILKKNYEQMTPGRYRLTVSIEEGKQRFLGSADIPGHEYLEGKAPFIAGKKGATSVPFDKNRVVEQNKWLLEHFKKEGFPYVRVQPTFDEREDSLHIIWTVDKGEPIRCGKVVLAGFSTVKPEVLHDILAVKEGEVWKKDLVREGYSRLKAADVFKQIRIYPESSSVDPFCRNLVVQVQDEEPFEVRTRIGFQQMSKNFGLKKGSTYKVGGTLLWRNPTRRADEAWLDIDVTRFERKIDICYQRPTLFHLPLSVMFKGYANKYTQPLTHGSRKKLYEVTQEGALVSMSKQFDRISSAVNVGFEWMETKNISTDLATAINFGTTLIGKKIPYFFVEPNMFIDLLDDKVNPRKGMFSIATLKAMFPLRESSYLIRILVEQGMFFPLVKEHDITCASRIRFGHIFRETFSKIMPPERFYLGGANSIRGYLPDACSPLGSYVDESGVTQRVPQGGRTMVNANFELRLPVFQDFGCVLFQDFGALVEDISVLGTGSGQLAASGFGIRYQTPLGPLRFDIGWKWSKPFPEDSRYAWFLTFGHAF